MFTYRMSASTIAEPKVFFKILFTKKRIHKHGSYCKLVKKT